MRPLSATLFAFVLLITASHAMSQEKKDADKPPYYLTDVELDKALAVEEKVEAPKEYVWIIYFHRVPGCETCQLMSRYVFATMKERFADDVKGKWIVLRYKNFEDKKNATLVKKLGIKSPSLAVVQVKDGKMVKAKLADKIWSLAAERDQFVDYVAREVKSYLPDNKEEEK